MEKDPNIDTEFDNLKQLDVDKLLERVAVSFRLTNRRVLIQPAHQEEDHRIPAQKRICVLMHYYDDSQTTQAAMAFVADPKVFVNTAKCILQELAPELLS